MATKISHSPTFALQAPPTQKPHRLTSLFLALVGVGIVMLYVQYTRSLKNRLLALVSQSSSHLEQSQYKEALKTCEEALACRPQEANLLARIHLIMSYSYEKRDQNYPLAQDSLSKAKDAQPKGSGIRTEIQNQKRNLKARTSFTEGNRLFKEHKYAEAIRSYTQGLAQNPLDETLYQALHAHLSWARGEEWMERSSWDEAIQHYQAGLSSKCQDPNVRATLHVRIGNAQTEKNDHSSAATSYSEAKNCKANDPSVKDLIQNSEHDLQAKKLIDQAGQKVAAKQHEAALEYFEQASKLKPRKDLQSVITNHRAYCFLNLGQLKRVQGAHDQALENFQKALSCKPTDTNLAAHIYLEKGMLHSRLGQYELAVESYIKASECQPGDLYIQEIIKGEKRNIEAKKMVNQGLQNTAKHNYEEALQNYEAALACNPSSSLQPKIHANITKCKIDKLIYQGQQNLKKQAYDSALQNFNEALAYNPSDIHDQVIIYDGMGNAYIGLQQYSYAELCFLLAANFKPMEPSILTMLSQSQDVLQKALQANKQMEAGTKLFREEKYEEALQHFEAALSHKPPEKLHEIICRRMERLAERLYEKGLTNYESNNFLQALINLIYALRCKPTDEELKGQIYYRLAKCYIEKPHPDYNEAFHDFSEALCFNFSKKFVATIDRGILYDHYKKNLSKAIQDYQTVIDSTSEGKPNYNPHLECMARLLKANAQRRQALLCNELLQSNLEVVMGDMVSLPLAIAKMSSPHYAFKVEAYYQRALCHHALNQLEKAGELYTTVVDIAEHNYTKASALCDRALCFEQQKNYIGALTDYELASSVTLQEDKRVDLETCIDRAQDLAGKPSSYKNSEELRAAINEGKSRVQQRLASSSQA